MPEGLTGGKTICPHVLPGIHEFLLLLKMEDETGRLLRSASLCRRLSDTLGKLLGVDVVVH